MTVENIEHGDHRQGGEKLQRTLKNRHIQLIATRWRDWNGPVHGIG